MEDERAALLKAIIDAPGDDLPRLVYADWLVENREGERAEFIRVQCELAELESTKAERPTPCPENVRMYELAKTSRTLLRNYWDNWFPWTKPNRGYTFASIGAEGLKILDGDGEHLTLETSRGFISEVFCKLVQFAGGPCSTCNGYGHHARNDSLSVAEVRLNWPMMPQLICETCKGERAVPGIAAKLFAEQPVTRVLLTDREPLYLPQNPVVREYAWRLGLGDRASLPIAIFSLLKCDFTHNLQKCYSGSPERAMNALSTACIAYGRSLTTSTAAELAHA